MNGADGHLPAALAPRAGEPFAKGRGVLESAFAVLEELGRLEEAGLSQLAGATGLPKTTTHRLLGQLAGLGAVHRLADGRYQIGARAFRLGQMWRPGPLLRAAAAGPLRHALVRRGPPS
ncbi:helix-turn-helix domain-containing protein [Actinomadura roseirufa]|uniref:helix-turn-helix domain-containing protein n=1 Tax=Actinomadura roseirufa TaxID=2094049 RepID=UPI00104102D2|nr:helix-turn-helix domain-containing protein [Actinomadura roseirufa]